MLGCSKREDKPRASRDRSMGSDTPVTLTPASGNQRCALKDSSAALQFLGKSPFVSRRNALPSEQ